jgi:hypothetical protein
MKNLIKFCAALITASVLFSSCESNFSITKRHYNKGYYIDYTKSNKAITSKADNNISQNPTMVSVNTGQNVVKQDAVPVNSVQSIVEKNAIAVTSIKKALPKVGLRPVATQNLPVKTEANESSFLGNNSTRYNSPEKATNITDGDHGERRALSLLWLVIVIVLILWLIGLLAGGFGLGGFINLLLLVALILLILWLLRIL